MIVCLFQTKLYFYPKRALILLRMSIDIRIRSLSMAESRLMMMMMIMIMMLIEISPINGGERTMESTNGNCQLLMIDEFISFKVAIDFKLIHIVAK